MSHYQVNIATEGLNFKTPNLNPNIQIYSHHNNQNYHRSATSTVISHHLSLYYHKHPRPLSSIPPITTISTHEVKEIEIKNWKILSPKKINQRTLYKNSRMRRRTMAWN
ncbi:hypothetical protein Patl1_12314 [Pistacia atlantica]|uniref:Uncharacterized protein n=1 Tax=Pistacia atlantica TaxID=434234 RepID=A0ACC1A2C2_9ROSI|nr:hypothetical protein Patl1_12314 [Pistacia atlantica]